MAHFKIKKGLDIPLSNPPQGKIEQLKKSSVIGLDLSSFSSLRLRLLVEPSQHILSGQVIAEDKMCESRKFVSPFSGKIKEIILGEKRRVYTIVIEVDDQQKHAPVEPFDYSSKEPVDLVRYIHEKGLSSSIVSRPFCKVTHPEKMPNAIFVKALESAPYVPPAEMQVKNYEKQFQEGLNVLNRIKEGGVHLIYHKDTGCEAFFNAQNIHSHTIQGPHPISSLSIPIEKLHPIQEVKDVVWTLDVLGVITLGQWFLEGKYFNQRIVSLAGPALDEKECVFYQTEMGCSFSHLCSREFSEPVRVVSGDPLMGTNVGKKGFLGFFHSSFCLFYENEKREMLHFFRLGKKKYTATNTYLSKIFKKQSYDLDTNQHGEPRAFVDGGVYEKVMPLRIPTMQLIKAILADDFELAKQLGILEIAPEDFALPAFICPSKIEMIEIVKKALSKYSEEISS